jgi:hypothetical protein
METEIEKWNISHKLKNNEYCLGSYIKTNDDYYNNMGYGKIYLIGTRIPSNLFFEILSSDKIEKFIEEYSFYTAETPKLEILQTKRVSMKVDSYTWIHYTVLVKTFWLKIIQRTWKKIFQKKMTHYKRPANFIKMQMTGHWYVSVGLRGMLSSLPRKLKLVCLKKNI